MVDRVHFVVSIDAQDDAPEQMLAIFDLLKERCPNRHVTVGFSTIPVQYHPAHIDGSVSGG